MLRLIAFSMSISFLSSLLVFTLISRSARPTACLSALMVSLVGLGFWFPTLGMNQFPLLFMKLNLWAWDLSALALCVIFLMTLVDAPLFTQFARSTLPIIYTALGMVLLIFFQTTSALFFFIFFETSALMIFYMIILNGYQPERLQASMSLLIYTSSGALPLLMTIVLFMFVWKSQDLSMRHGFSANGPNLPLTYTIFSMLVITSFLIKFPIYSFHSWLPKAHVEASSSGSMLLAGVLLKMGGHGIYQMGNLIPYSVASFWSTWALLGGALISFVCLWQTDFKILIAYSSVAHMALVISSLLVSSPLGETAALLIMLSHGLSSTLMFYMSGILYNWTTSRQMAMNTGGLTAIPAMATFWFIGNMVNMGTPPFFNFWGEILGVMAMSSFSFFLLVPLSLTLWVTVAYSLALYGSIQTGQKGTSTKAALLLSPREFMNNGLQVALIALALPGMLFFV